MSTRKIYLWFGIYAGLAVGAVAYTHRDRFVSELHAAGVPVATGELANIVQLAESLEGRPYLAGGADEDGFDCSGFTYYVYGRAGYRIPRTVRSQYEGLVSVDEPRPGDLVFFAIGDEREKGARRVSPIKSRAEAPVSHVGIYVGDNTFIHAPSTGGMVRLDSLSAPYWQGRFRGARMIIMPELSDSDFAQH